MVRNLSLSGITVFDRFAREYDQWFIENCFAYMSEVEAIRRYIPDSGLGVEVGAGSGRFSVPFGITTGVEPSEEMARLAQSRGLFIVRVLTESLSWAKGMNQ